MTNADRIRSITDEELFDFIGKIEIGDMDFGITFCGMCSISGNIRGYDCEDCLKDWLKRDSKDCRGIDY